METATEACSAALYDNGTVIERYELAPQEHNRLILHMMEQVLAEAGLTLANIDALAFGCGPGSFTGLRIAAGVVQGIAFAADLPVAPVSTLAVLAAEALAECESDYAFPCLDARMDEVYWAIYRRSESLMPERIQNEQVLAPAMVRVAEPVSGVAIGSGWTRYTQLLTEQIGSGNLVGVLADRFPRAGWIARLGCDIYRQGACVNAENSQPLYVRNPVYKKAV
ncbi:tRNA (adenosine(37)-N6)-threonylcarbamoyltransferase complex dimerization subunit type 1 TsaB [Candidatus Methylospira mobilis]|uniref:tRNA (adenosine(37)-N6)-threonylcarbamoyltransferase complex dimerization subunit type 1 TsaB n=1 Tax=Candidatus Methylospira mobilis TaxID=1808979 RepID=UPI0028E9D04E|nr:tRNA (adenosine(37)-N6)-threonylcarbamoyltransferase complex dimerization subunit type 1 TsaB [Candidatus Methylospira mobilis]WNV04399.1 tRNA (adenosine(37)-N6)-threonylcarbamoyltransferase complex dimerization subunit type 1 TsaB [Candidatus Methylospira mobilis]